MNKAVLLMNVPELAEPLFHGSVVQVRDIDLSRGVVKKDFGRGFYTTTIRIQAEKFALIKARRENVSGGWVSVFEYVHHPEVTIKKFERADTAWLSFVLTNRGFSKGPTHAAGGEIDIVIGPVANDAVGLVLNQLVIGTYGDPASPEAKNTAIRLLDTSKLYNQVFFGTGRAVSCLKYKESYPIGINRSVD